MAASRRVWIVGAGGMLGRELVAAYQRDQVHRLIDLSMLDVEELDIRDADRVASSMAERRPDVVINAAAYTDVDGCESNVGLAFAVNSQGPANLATACRLHGCRLVHVSTDFVFDGRKARPYLPEDSVNPLSVYGRSKADGDQRVREHLDDHVIVRTSWLFGFHGKNFVKTILELAGEREELHVVTDQVGCPTYARDLASALMVLEKTELTGTYHFCNAGCCSWHEFATEIVRLSGTTCRVLPTTSVELNRPAVRSAYSALSTDKLTWDAGLRPRPWREALAECIEELRQSAVCR